MMKTLVLASNNKGKIREFSALLSTLGVEVKSQGELGVSSAEEPFGTFIENCLAKARHASRETGLPALADDSGICADALNGAPGVFSARYAGGHADDAANNAKLDADLAGKPVKTAHYTCVLVAVRTWDDPEPLIAQGRWFGEWTSRAAGEGGFGYDPHFYIPELGRTAAELSADEKNKISHRAQAMARMKELMSQVWGWK